MIGNKGIIASVAFCLLLSLGCRRASDLGGFKPGHYVLDVYNLKFLPPYTRPNGVYWDFGSDGKFEALGLSLFSGRYVVQGNTVTLVPANEEAALALALLMRGQKTRLGDAPSLRFNVIGGNKLQVEGTTGTNARPGLTFVFAGAQTHVKL